MTNTVPKTLMTDHDVYLFREGKHFRLYRKLGAHPMEVGGQSGVFFAVWAPNAGFVSVMGDFNGWDSGRNPLFSRGDESGIWEGFVPGAILGQSYKYHISARDIWYSVNKADPLAFWAEEPPRTASRIAGSLFQWTDENWMSERWEKNGLHARYSIYEVHLGSWRRSPRDPHRLLDYRTLAHELADYALQQGFTHVELLPVTEHPFYGSWGYQTTSYFAPTARYGHPDDFRYFVNHLHRNGIGVIMDWVPSHFASDEHGLVFFDGTHLYEHQDARKGFHPDWKSFLFNYGRNEVRAFLISNALYWLDEFHIDGLRVDAVASMLYLDYSRKAGEWEPNIYGGNENLEAIDFLRECNRVVYENHPDVQTMAEESTSWPMVSRPLYVGGLGFGMKWNMGWMNDTLEYFSRDPVHRKYHHNRLTFNIMYAWSENFILPLSHDEVVHGKRSLAGRMPGDDWQKLANLRLLLGYMFAQPGKNLLFMGGEFGQWREWNHDQSLDWHLLDQSDHKGVQDWVRDLNAFSREHSAMYAQDFSPQGFAWVDCQDADQSVLSFLRFDRGNPEILVVCNFTPVPRMGYQVGVERHGYWIEALNSDARVYGGSGLGNMGRVHTLPRDANGRPFCLELVLPPLAALFFVPE